MLTQKTQRVERDLRDRERVRDRERQRARETDRERVREKDRERETWPFGFSFYIFFLPHNPRPALCKLG